MKKTAEISPKIEEYLESIYLASSAGRTAMGARLAEAFDVSAPTVTDTVKRMQRDGYIEVDAAKRITLTPRGKEVAESILRRHALSERLLTDVLGMDWHSAHAEACKLEHAISPEVEERLLETLGSPTTCPHGNPIPGVDTPDGEPAPAAFRLSEARQGQTLLVRHVTEDAEEDAELLAHFDRNGLRPGARLLVSELLPANGTVTVLVEDRPVMLGQRAAERLWVSEA